MPQCVKIRKKKRQANVGDMNDRIIIHLRSIQPPSNGGVDFAEQFTPKRTVWALVNTVEGETFFDSSNIETVVTHEIIIRWFQGITSEDYIELADGTLLDILPTENLDNRAEFIKLKCTLRGPREIPINQI